MVSSCTSCILFSLYLLKPVTMLAQVWTPCSSEPSWAPGFVTLARAQYNFGEVGMLSPLDILH